MFNTGNCPSVPIVANLDGNNGNNWNDGSWLWFLIVVFAIFGGWGNGFGGFGGTNGGVGSEIQRGFDNQAVVSKLDGISNGLCDGFYAMNNSMLTGFNGINTNIMQTGYGIQQAVNADTVANMQNTNALQSQIANCCCETREAICAFIGQESFAPGEASDDHLTGTATVSVQTVPKWIEDNYEVAVTEDDQGYPTAITLTKKG